MKSQSAFCSLCKELYAVSLWSINPLTGKHANLRVGVVVESEDFYELSI